MVVCAWEPRPEAERDRHRQTHRPCWSAFLAYFASSRPVRDPISKRGVENTGMMRLKIVLWYPCDVYTHVPHMHTYAPMHKCTHRQISTCELAPAGSKHAAGEPLPKILVYLIHGVGEGLPDTLSGFFSKLLGWFSWVILNQGWEADIWEDMLTISTTTVQLWHRIP